MDTSAPVRIARIITRLGVGGAERYVCALTAHLDPKAYRSWLISGQVQAAERECSEFLSEANVQPIYIKDIRRGLGFRDLKAAVTLSRLLESIKPQIVETHTAKAGALGRLVTRMRWFNRRHQPRLIHTFHGHVFDKYFSGPVAGAFIGIERFLAHFTDLVVTVSPSVRHELIERYQIADAHKIRVVPLGFDFSWLNELPLHRGWLRARLQASEAAVVFGTVGRLAKIKNTAFLLRAFARLLDSVPRDSAVRNSAPIDARLVIIGDGELADSLRALARQLNVSDRVLFCGWELDRAKIFSDLDVTCLSSLNEGSPVCLIESLAAKVPVIATRVGGVADVVSPRTDGELVEAGGEAAFAAAMLRLALSKERISDARSNDVQNRYSIRRLVRDMEGIYEELMEPGQAASVVPDTRMARFRGVE